MFSMLRPEMATFLPLATAMSMMRWARCTLEAKIAMMMRFFVEAKMLLSAMPTCFSEGVYPLRAALVLSAISSSTPSSPRAARRLRSRGSPSTGV